MSRMTNTITKLKERLRPTHAATRVMVKTMGMMGAVKILYILCALVRNKLIAIWVGPAGVGLTILYTSVLELIGQSTRLNIDQSAVRDISKAAKADLPATVSVVRIWSVALGLLAAVLVCLLSPVLSYWSFGDTSKWWTFCVLAIMPASATIFNGLQAILQGTKNYTAIARANSLITVVGVVAAIPLAYFLREDSIVWILFAYGMASLTASLVFAPRFKAVAMTVRQVIARGKSFLKLGALISVGVVAAQLFNYLFILFLNDYASTDTLGIYQAGYTLVNTYVGLMFAGMWMDFFPKVSAMTHSPFRTSVTVSHQMAISVWLLMPLVAAFVAVDQLAVTILYADTFLDMLPFITLGIAGVVLRSASWCLSFVILARGDGHIYVITETVSGAVFLILHVLLFSTWGFIGLGVAYILWYAVYTAMCYWIYTKRYGLTLMPGTWKSVAVSTAFCLAAAIAKLLVGWWLPLIMALAIIPHTIKYVRK